MTNTLLIQCPACRTGLLDGVFNRGDLAPCPRCGASLQVELFPAYFRPIATGRDGEVLLVEGESSCFYHPQKKAAVPCDACGRFLCALCDCEVKGRHLCPACLESGHKKKKIAGLEDMRVLHRYQALVLALLPLGITGIAAVWMALWYRKEPGSIVRPMRWAFPVALVFGGLQTLAVVLLILYAFFG
jgi:hypothetical protein